MQNDSHPSAVSSLVPTPETVRLRLATVLTEARLLRLQLKVSERAARERERLQRHATTNGGGGHAA